MFMLIYSASASEINSDHYHMRSMTDNRDLPRSVSTRTTRKAGRFRSFNRQCLTVKINDIERAKTTATDQASCIKSGRPALVQQHHGVASGSAPAALFAFTANIQLQRTIKIRWIAFGVTGIPAAAGTESFGENQAVGIALPLPATRQ